MADSKIEEQLAAVGSMLNGLLANIGAGAAMAAVVTLLTFWENIERIKNKHMRFSIVGCILSFVAATTCVSTAFRAQATNPTLFVDRIIAATFFYDLTFSLLTYHSAFRTILICRPFYKNVHLIAASITVMQMLVHGTASYFWASNMKFNYGGTSPISQKMEMVVLIFYSVVESILFLITQYKIIESKSAVLGEVSSYQKGALYAKGMMRSIAYTSSITLGFLALGNILPEQFMQLEAWNFPMYGPVFCIIIMLTDVSRFQACISTLTKSSGGARSQSGSEPSGIKFAPAQLPSKSALGLNDFQV